MLLLRVVHARSKGDLLHGHEPPAVRTGFDEYRAVPLADILQRDPGGKRISQVVLVLLVASMFRPRKKYIVW